MQSAPPESAPPDADRWALICAILWVAGAFACRFVGVWGGVGGVAIVAGGLTWLVHRKSLVALLRVERRAIVAGVVAGALMTAATYALYPRFVQAAPGLAEQTRALYTLFNSGWAPLRFGLLPLVILGEELVWRGLVQSVVERREGRIAGLLVSSFVYAAAHLPAATPLLALVALCCGLYWGAVRVASGSLLAPLIAHLAWDLCVMVLFPLA